jgi:predicted nucleotidyltransferase
MAVIDALIEQRAKEAIQMLSKYARVKAAYLFGSHVDGTPDKYSDIDIAVFIDNAEDLDFWRRAEIAVSVQKEVGDDIELHFFSAEALAHPEPASFAAYILAHGVPVAFNGR